MAKELKVQTEIRKSVIFDGGYAVKQSNQFTIGVADLKVCLYPFAPCDVEVKDFGEVTDSFDRGAGVTPKQADTIRRINDVYKDQTIYTPSRRCAGVVVRLIHRGVDVLVPAKLVGGEWRVRHDYTIAARRERGGYYGMRPLLEEMGICKIAKM